MHSNLFHNNTTCNDLSQLNLSYLGHYTKPLITNSFQVFTDSFLPISSASDVNDLSNERSEQHILFHVSNVLDTLEKKFFMCMNVYNRKILIYKW